KHKKYFLSIVPMDNPTSLHKLLDATFKSRPHCVICLKAELWLDGSIIIPRMGHRLKWNHHLLLHGQKSLSPCYFKHRSKKNYG
ncbi:hypothetical protein, partial [Paenibacillus sp. 32O-W]|uniref:hypothetical protein n=1 Tax=Paenibacillus sp. 32O-W TaxID=1695218 RepID=UPI001C92D967